VVFGILATILLVLLARRLQRQDHETDALHHYLRSSQQ
jgi:hypothetical protein